MGLLRGKRALVCGSSQGIGRAVAEKFAESGAGIVLVARDHFRLSEVLGRLDRGSRQSHRIIVCDFSDPDLLKRKLTEELPEIGPIEILVNNTGGPPAGPIAKAEAAEFLDAFSKHLVCNQILVQAVVEGMKQRGGGRIINIISTSVRAPIPGLGVSNTIRGAVASWSKTLAGELGPFGITVNNILPGFTETTRLSSLIERNAVETRRSVEEVAESMKATIPLRRFARAEEIANAALFLASELASYVNGINLPVDGGRLDCL